MRSTIAAITVTVVTVTIDGSSTGQVAADLLATMAATTGCDDLAYAAPPTPLLGGYHATMLRFRLADPPVGLAGELVARMIPQADLGAWEATVQAHVAASGFPTPAIRLTAPPDGPLGRFLIVMDHVDGHPPMAGLDPATILRRLPSLVRGVPDQLADIAVPLHSVDPGPLEADLAALGSGLPLTTAGFVEGAMDAAAGLGGPDLVEAAERLLADEPASTAKVVAHGDLHPFNLIVTPERTVLVDWTLGRVADPGFTLGFTELTLAHPPLPVPPAVRRALGPVGRSMATRFVRRYRAQTAGTAAAVDDRSLDWHRRVHALRILVEVAGWEATGPPPGHHPWYVLAPVARRLLGVPG